MFIHYFIILHNFIVVFSSTNNRSTLIFIINSVKSRNSNRHTHASLFYRKNRTIDLMETSLMTNRTMYDVNRIRIRRDFLRENTINNEDNVNIYGEDDGRYFRNQQEEIAEQKRDFDGKYYRPIRKKFKMRDNNELYEDNIDRINRARNEEERNAEKRYMQNDEELNNRNRLSNDYNREYFQINPNRKYLDDYYNMLKKQRDKYGKQYHENDYLDKQNSI